MKAKVSVIIVTYNGQLWIERCLSSLLESDYSELNIVVVDNASTDNTLAIIKHKFPNIILIEESINHGFGKANNIGIAYALDNLEPSYIFLLNQDTTVVQNTLKLLTSKLKQNPQYGILSPIHLNDWGNDYDHLFKDYIESIPELKSLNVALKSTCIYKVPFINAAAWLIEVNTIKKIGVFNPIFPHYGEDNDYIFRLHNKGYLTGILTGTFIRHYRNARFSNPTEDSFSKLVQKQYIQALIWINNVNLNFYKTYLAFLRQQITGLFSNASNGDWENFKIVFTVTSRVLGNTFKIIIHRSHKLIK